MKSLHRVCAALVMTTLVAGLGCAPARTAVMAPQDPHHDHARHDADEDRGRLKTPSAIREEHEHLHDELAAALAAGGDTAVRAEAVEKILAKHFKSEEEFATPPLGLLEDLGNGRRIDDADARRAIGMSDRLRDEYPTMLREHRQLVEALGELKAAATRENKPKQAAFAQALILHARHEEQVLYPAALLVGEHLRLQRKLATADKE
jgi:hypothetical protein